MPTGSLLKTSCSMCSCLVQQCVCNITQAWSHPPLLLGSTLPVPRYEGYLSSQLAKAMKGRRIYVDQPCFVVASTQDGVGCLDTLGDNVLPPSAPLVTLYAMLKN